MEELEPVRIVCATWNLCGCNPTREALPHLRDWLAGAFDWDDGGGADVVAAGFVEVVDLSAYNCVRESISESADLSRRVTGWRQLVSEVLGSGFELVANQALVGLALFVFARRAPRGAWTVARALAREGREARRGPAPRRALRRGGAHGPAQGLLANRARCLSSVLEHAAVTAADAPPAPPARRTLCFAHCHMAANLKSLAARNAEFHTVAHSKLFPRCRATAARPRPPPRCPAAPRERRRRRRARRHPAERVELERVEPERAARRRRPGLAPRAELHTVFGGGGAAAKHESTHAADAAAPEPRPPRRPRPRRLMGDLNYRVDDPDEPVEDDGAETALAAAPPADGQADGRRRRAEPSAKRTARRGVRGRRRGCCRGERRRRRRGARASPLKMARPTRRPPPTARRPRP